MEAGSHLTKVVPLTWDHESLVKNASHITAAEIDCPRNARLIQRDLGQEAVKTYHMEAAMQVESTCLLMIDVMTDMAVMTHCQERSLTHHVEAESRLITGAETPCQGRSLLDMTSLSVIPLTGPLVVSISAPEMTTVLRPEGLEVHGKLPLTDHQVVKIFAVMTMMMMLTAMQAVRCCKPNQLLKLFYFIKPVVVLCSAVII